MKKNNKKINKSKKQKKVVNKNKKAKKTVKKFLPISKQHKLLKRKKTAKPKAKKNLKVESSSIKDELDKQFNKTCIFCDIAKGKSPCLKIAESKKAIAILDVNPLADGHTLIISKQHFSCWEETPDEVLMDMAKLSKKVAAILQKKLKCLGINYLSNQEPIAGQAILHTHLHVIPKYNSKEGFVLDLGNINTNSLQEVYEAIQAKDEKSRW